MDPGEECDDGSDNSDDQPNACRTDCTLPRCGDDVIDDEAPYLEDCDDGSSSQDDACPAGCKFEIFLQPRLVMGLGLCTVSDRRVYVTDRSDTDITGNSAVDFRWIGNGIDQGLLDSLLEDLAGKVLSGTINVELAEIDVSRAGVVHFQSPGVNVLQARWTRTGGEIYSNYALVFGAVGEELARVGSLEIVPWALSSAASNTLAWALNNMFGTDADPPMILFMSGPDCYVIPSLLGNTAQVVAKSLSSIFSAAGSTESIS